ncbi:MAG: hypothetical protein F4Y20_08910 [Acidobacteria bacterium]|nr:hypothetical protein [Acidobacteriota bacterium]MYH20893.1 hypothetical protein [Acidobacteriota bacterium]MYK78369.1 hypothetical protein [Acidobacteriota bacterium]
MGEYAIEERLDWRRWVTPKLLSGRPVHRWYVFPHSYTSELVDELIDEWGLGCQDVVLDPFSGAGTTLLAAKESGVSASGYDLSPLAVLVARAKVADYDIEELETAWAALRVRIDPSEWQGGGNECSPLIRRALPGRLLSAFRNIDRNIAALPATRTVQSFLRLALLGLIPHYSRAAATGGWLKWVKNGKRSSSLLNSLERRVRMMMRDIPRTPSRVEGAWDVERADARCLPGADDRFTAVITSPPYPNRHDYTRVFGVELMLGFLDYAGTRDLRFQSFHSHPEARPTRPRAEGYSQPRELAEAVERIRGRGGDSRVPRMVEGYFLDTFLALQEVKRLCRPNSRIGWVVGNAQYRGVSVPVDELTAEIGEQLGLQCEKVLVARYRGNSAQQMGRYGRQPSRESVVVFRA